LVGIGFLIIQSAGVVEERLSSKLDEFAAEYPFVIDSTNPISIRLIDT
jgi:hypothetical protein